MKLKNIAISAIVAGLLIGCGNNSDNTTNENVQGIVADGYIKGAKVLLDTNCNGVQDNGEISVLTDENGKFILNTDANLTGACIVTTGGFDTERLVNIKGKLIAPVADDIVVTPLTTMAYMYSKDNNVSYEEATNILADKLNVSPNDFTSDPEKTPAIKSLTIQIQSSIDLISETNTSIDTTSLYTTIAKNIAETNGDLNLSKVVTENIPVSDTIKRAVTATVTLLGNNDIVSKYADIQENIVEAINSNKNITDFKAYINYINALSNENMTNAIANINALNTNISDLNSTANTKTANITDAKNMMGQIREVIYEFVEPNIDKQENNTSTIVGSIISNANNSLKPVINDTINSLITTSEIINSSINNFNIEVEKDFNSTFVKLNQRFNAIAEILNQYDENQTFSDVKTTYGDVLSHTYNNDNGLVTDTYTINNQTLTVKYSLITQTLDSVSSSSDGVISLSEDGLYNLNITSLSLKNNKVDFSTNGEIYSENSKATISGDINISLDVNDEMFKSAYVISSLNNLNISVNGDVKTSANREFKGLFNLTDLKLELNGLYKDDDNDLSLNGIVTLNLGNVLWKKYLDESIQTMDDITELALVNIDDKLVTQYKINWHTNEVNLTTFDGTKYECNVSDFWPNLEGLQCKDSPNISKTTYNDIKGKVIQFKVNNKSFLVDDLWSSWHEVDQDVDIIDLKVDSANYDIYENSDGIAFLADNGNSETITSINYNIFEPLDAKELIGDIKFSGNIVHNDTKASLDLAIVKNSSDDNIDFYIDNLAFISDKVNITAPNLLKVETQNGNVTNVSFKDFNATVTDINGNDAKLTDVTYLGTTDNNIDTSSFYGKISYLDTTLAGYIYVTAGQNNYIHTKSYVDVLKEGYEPFTIILNGEGNDTYDNTFLVIKKGVYSIAGYHTYNVETNENNETIGIDRITLFDNNGVFLNSYQEEGSTLEFNLKDKDGNKLADINTTNNNWEIKYSDDSTETLY